MAIASVKRSKANLEERGPLVHTHHHSLNVNVGNKLVIFTFTMISKF